MPASRSQSREQYEGMLKWRANTVPIRRLLEDWDWPTEGEIAIDRFEMREGAVSVEWTDDADSRFQGTLYRNEAKNGAYEGREIKPDPSSFPPNTLLLCIEHEAANSIKILGLLTEWEEDVDGGAVRLKYHVSGKLRRSVQKEDGKKKMKKKKS